MRARLSSTQAVHNALARLDIMAFYGRSKLDQRGLNIYKPMAVVQLQPDGKTYTVFPPDIAEKDALYPLPPVAAHGSAVRPARSHRAAQPPGA